MLTLLSECHFWTANSQIRIKPTDFGSFRYFSKKCLASNSLLEKGKAEYAEKRDNKVILHNSKPQRLKNYMRKFEELLQIHKIVHSEWRDANVALLLLSNGLIVHISINCFTGDVCKIAFDKFFVGKLATDVIVNAIFTRQHILLSYNTNQITMVHLQKPNMRRSSPEKISNMEPKIVHILISGPSERKLARHLVVNSSFDTIVIWTKSSQNEVYPWRPTIRDQDRANVHLFKLTNMKLESIAYCWTENDPVCVEFVRASDGHLLTVEQKVTRKGEITAEICSYEIGNMKMQRNAVTSIPIGTQICCYSFSPDQEKLVLGTIDRYVCIHDLGKRITKFASKTDIIPTLCAWHPDSGLIIIANDRSQFQCLDISLSFVANQPISEDVTPSNLYDLSHYFAIQPTLFKIAFSSKPELNSYTERHAQTECFLLLLFENGPIGCLRFFSGTGMSGDVHNSGLTADVLVCKYLAINQLEKAINVLLSLNWDTYGAMCLIALHKISNYVFTRQEAKRSRNELLRKALQSFTTDVAEETENDFGDQVIDLKRRFFVFLLRHKLYSEAFEMAREVEDYDLFMDLFNITKTDTKLYNFAQESFRQAELVLSQVDQSVANGNSCAGDTNSISSCSHSSCSDCTALHHRLRNLTDNKIGIGIYPKATLLPTNTQMSSSLYPSGRHGLETSNNNKNYVPPLPYFKSILNSEDIRINIPKPELRIERIGDHSKIATHRKTNLHSDIKTAYSIGMANRFKNNFSNSPAANTSSSSSVPSFQKDGSNPPIIAPVPLLPPPLPHHKKPSTRLWSHIPDQTIGIPVVTYPKTSNLSNSLSILPRATSSLNFSTANLQQHGFDFDNVQRLANANKSESCFNIPKFYQHPLVSGTIPSSMQPPPPSGPLSPHHSNPATSIEEAVYQKSRKPAISILSNSGSNSAIAIGGGSPSSAFSSASASTKKDSGEKNKVKFSDTVQVAVVPEIPRKEKPPPPKRNGFHPRLTDPRKELADSLPLCHPHDDYLKDFNPAADNRKDEDDPSPTSNQTKNSGTIKVVHFGVV